MARNEHDERSFVRLGWMWLIVVAWFASAAPSLAQDGEDETKPPSKFLEISGKYGTAESRQFKAAWRGSSQLDTAKFKEFLQQRYLPALTQEAARAGLPGFRDELNDDFLQKEPGNPESLEFGNQVVFEFMYGVARGARQARLRDGSIVYVFWLGRRLVTLDHQDVTSEVQALWHPPKDFHPAVRYNAMLIVGNLDSKVAKFGRTSDRQMIVREPPDPYAAALIPLLDVAIGKPYQPTIEKFLPTESQPAPDPVRIAALLGLRRHVSVDRERNEPEKELILQEMLDLAQKKPDGNFPEAATWYRRLALEVVGGLQYGGSSGEAVARLAAIVADPEIPVAVRCAAAEAIGRIPRQSSATSAKPLDVAANMVRLAAEVCAEELAQSDYPAQPMATRQLMMSIEQILIGLRGEYVPPPEPDDDDRREADADPEPTGGLVLWVAGNEKDELLDLQQRVELAIKIAMQIEQTSGSDRSLRLLETFIQKVQSEMPRE
ncbi:MAG: hypothetical protein DWQ42_14880 [Planctomycetota bacterium]|nr:MAG: hypothetical protein DWQ42_14880 [Planctomycetota bacterium]REK47628.1 MAG: hypothetical protein DWQ46_04160 [Planctomycetota bacterium]